MNREKISDFVDVWAQTVGLTEKRYINVIKSDIARRCTMYENQISSISTKDDGCKAYIIKPVNGEYSIEDFLLNRLMLGMREIDFSGALDENSGDYVAQAKALNVNVGLLNSQVTEKSTRHPGLQGKNIQIIKKTIEHELGHCFKSSFKDGYKAPIGNSKEQDTIYERLINNLVNYKNGKYAGQIKRVQELEQEGESDAKKTGLHDSEPNYKHDYRIKWVDELLNETEALELTDSNEVHERWYLQDENKRNSPSGNYVNVYNYMSKYSTFTSYGSIFKSLLGKEECFYAEYISSVDILKKFDEEYADIVEDVWGKNPYKLTPIQCIYMDFDDLLLKKFFNEEIILKLDEFFAKCYEKKVDKTISQSSGNLNQEFSETILKEIEHFQTRLTTNDDPQKRNALAHNIVFDNIKMRINQLNLQNSGPLMGENKENISKPQIQQESQQSLESVESPKMKFIKSFIQAYDDTETDFQYETRVNDEEFNMTRVKDMIDSKGLDRMLIMDLDGDMPDVSQGENAGFRYSQKQVSSMVRLLKAAQLLTDNKTLNPTGRNFLQEFTDLPSINDKLKQMKGALKDQDSYMFELKAKAETNRANGTLPQFPKTSGELDALGILVAKETPVMGTESNVVLPINGVKNDVKRSMITISEVTQAQSEIAERNQRNVLLAKAESNELSVEEKQKLDRLNAKYSDVPRDIGEEK